MPRKIEVWKDGLWWDWRGSMESAKENGYEGASVRYDGGVLERGIPAGLNVRAVEAPDQSMTVEEANASSPYLHRLRPYDDAP